VQAGIQVMWLQRNTAALNVRWLLGSRMVHTHKTLTHNLDNIMPRVYLWQQHQSYFEYLRIHWHLPLYLPIGAMRERSTCPCACSNGRADPHTEQERRAGRLPAYVHRAHTQGLLAWCCCMSLVAGVSARSLFQYDTNIISDELDIEQCADCRFRDISC
jgi:hypothetical protein